MANGWTAERRAQQATAVRRWQPWEKSTGPRTPTGKARVSRNAFRGGERLRFRKLVKALNDTMRVQRDALQ